ncbi:phospholysine phosphohistidine inorganic pyrophosphate phosphatase-like [Tubulanus polymorphus]|uniref:phospholysine phosphohistidine inorganic pyrophosphate phosphatase-like n=1 Tax=Tubulanus polymorphus TaxID=672921 RepID=UPI003DA54A20
MTAVKFWSEHSKSIGGFLLDISGVLYNCGEGLGTVVDGSVAAIDRLMSANVPVRFCTNETQCTRSYIVSKLQRLGFEQIKDALVFPPAPAVCKVLKERGLRPHLLVHTDVVPDFSEMDQTDPNCVVIGDAGEIFSYENVNIAFQKLLSMEKPVLITMGMGKFYKSDDNLNLDVGPFAKALEYACDIKSEVVGKPSETFFLTAVKDMNLEANKVVMIGDDIVSDVGGSQKAGLFGVQVRTGKYRPQDENHPTVKPHCYVDNLAEAVDLYLKYK